MFVTNYTISDSDYTLRKEQFDYLVKHIIVALNINAKPNMNCAKL